MMKYLLAMGMIVLLAGCMVKEERVEKARLHYDIAYDLLQKGEVSRSVIKFF